MGPADPRLLKLGLSLRALYELRKQGIHSLGDLLQRREAALRFVPRGRELLAELRPKLERHGLSLAK